MTGALEDTNEVADFIKLHGEGAKDIALKVENVEDAYKGAIERGAIAIREPWTESDESGLVKKR